MHDKGNSLHLKTGQSRLDFFKYVTIQIVFWDYW